MSGTYMIPIQIDDSDAASMLSLGVLIGHGVGLCIVCSLDVQVRVCILVEVNLSIIEHRYWLIDVPSQGDDATGVTLIAVRASLAVVLLIGRLEQDLSASVVRTGLEFKLGFVLVL